MRCTLTQNRFEGGAAPRSDVAQAKTQLDGAQVADTDITVTRAQFEHAIATLIGKPPAEFNLAPAPHTALQLPSSRSVCLRPCLSAGPILRLVSAALQKRTIRSASLALPSFPPWCLAPLADLLELRSRTGSTGRAVCGRWDRSCRRPSSMPDVAALSLSRQLQTMTAQ